MPQGVRGPNDGVDRRLGFFLGCVCRCFTKDSRARHVVSRDLLLWMGVDVVAGEGGVVCPGWVVMWQPVWG